MTVKDYIYIGRYQISSHGGEELRRLESLIPDWFNEKKRLSLLAVWEGNYFVPFFNSTYLSSWFNINLVCVSFIISIIHLSLVMRASPFVDSFFVGAFFFSFCSKIESSPMVVSPCFVYSFFYLQFHFILYLNSKNHLKMTLANFSMWIALYSKRNKSCGIYSSKLSKFRDKGKPIFMFFFTWGNKHPIIHTIS